MVLNLLAQFKGRLKPQEVPVVLISIIDWVDSRAR